MLYESRYSATHVGRDTDHRRVGISEILAELDCLSYPWLGFHEARAAESVSSDVLRSVLS
jgi:hypothetical protein